MHCPSCQHQIENADALYCSQCGESLRPAGICQHCARRLPVGAHYCDRCGSPVEGNSTRPPLWQTLPNAQTPSSETPAPPIQEPTPPSTAESSDYYHSRLIKLGVAEKDWVRIPAGEFLMGSASGEPGRFDNEPQHPVVISGFDLLKTPVTFAMYDAYCDELKLPKPPDEGWGRATRPVINVSYWQAMDYCIWLQKRTSWKIRLPTEAEWEYACRAGTTTPFWTGETITTDQANFDGNYSYAGGAKGIRRGQTTEVGQFPANPWGLYDMHGNVWEWCASLFDDDYTGLELQDAGCLRDNPHERVVRGGSWHNVPGALRCASRNKMGPNYHYLRIGFRIVREIE